MDSDKLGDISKLIGVLSQNPAALSALGGIMESMNQKPPPSESRPLDVSSLLSLLSGNTERNEKPPEEAPLSPFGSKDDVKKRIALLNAVKPFLSEIRREKLELIIKLLRLSELGELTKLLGKLN